MRVAPGAGCHPHPGNSVVVGPVVLAGTVGLAAEDVEVAIEVHVDLAPFEHGGHTLTGP